MAEDKTQDRPGGLTRREFLKKATRAGLGLAASSIAGGPLLAGLQKPEEKIKSQITQPSTSSLPSPLVSSITQEEAPISISEKKEILSTEPRPLPLKKELFFVSTQDRKKISDALEKIERQVAHYKKEEKDPEDRIKRTLKYKDVVMDVARKLGFKKESPVPELLLGLIFVESGGNPDAIAGKPNRKSGEKMEDGDVGKAKGLCQVKPDTAKEVAQRLGIQPGSYSLFDPKTSITFALEHLDHLYNDLFPDLGIAFWAYHLGEGNMAAAIETYLVEELNVPQALVDDILSNKEVKGTFKLVEDYSLTFLELINSEKVKEELRRRKAFDDDTEFYVPRIGAGMRFLGL